MESFLDCNFPELLAEDLGQPGRASRPTSFTPKISKSAIAAEGKQAPVFEELALGAITSPREKELLSKMTSLGLLEKKYSELLALGEELMKDTSDTDMSASDSSGGVEPPSIRKRKLSITTPATSITSGRKCSSSAQTSASTSPQNQVPPRSWLDSEEESPGIQHRRRSRTGRDDRHPIVSPPRQTSARYGHRSDSSRSRRRAPAVCDPFANFGDSMDEDDMVKALPYHDDIRPQRRSSSSRWNENGNDSLRVPRYRDRKSYGRRGHESSRSPPSPSCFIPTTETIDETPNRLPSWPSPERQKHSNIVTQHREYSDIAEDTESQDSQSIVSEGPAEPPNPTYSNRPVQQHESIETWFETVIDDFSHPSESVLEAPATKLPLSMDVLETLRVSVSCFPETMLLCSSLSIETIRNHARKVKYENKGTFDLSSATQPAQHGVRRKASNWRKFTSIARKNHPETISKTPTTTPTNFGCEEKSTWPDSSPVWASIRNTFPNGTDYLCDALYAHLLTYNYIDSLCPRILTTALPQPTRPPSARDSMDYNSSAGGQNSSNGRIPRKAASLLGLQNSIAEDQSPNPSMTSTRSQPWRSSRPSISSAIAAVSRSSTMASSGRGNVLRNKRSYVISKKLGVDPGYIYPNLPQQTPASVFVTPKGQSINKRRSSGGPNGNHPSMNVTAGSAVATDVPAFPHLSGAEQSLVDLRTGLSTCIKRLIATLKMTSCNEDAGDGGTLAALGRDICGGEGSYNGFGRNDAALARQNGASDGGGNAVDAFLMRSLCELVRVSEGSGRASRH